MQGKRASITETYWSEVSLNWISLPSGACFVNDGAKTGPRGGSKSAGLGGGSLYLTGPRTLGFLLWLGFCGLDLGSGVARALSGPSVAPFDSLFLRDSFLVLAARGASSCFTALKSGFSGEETAGWWSSSSTRFCGMEGVGGIVGVVSLCGDGAPDDIFGSMYRSVLMQLTAREPRKLICRRGKAKRSCLNSGRASRQFSLACTHHF